MISDTEKFRDYYNQREIDGVMKQLTKAEANDYRREITSGTSARYTKHPIAYISPKRYRIIKRLLTTAKRKGNYDALNAYFKDRKADNKFMKQWVDLDNTYSKMTKNQLKELYGVKYMKNLPKYRGATKKYKTDIMRRRTYADKHIAGDIYRPTPEHVAKMRVGRYRKRGMSDADIEANYKGLIALANAFAPGARKARPTMSRKLAGYVNDFESLLDLVKAKGTPEEFDEVTDLGVGFNSLMEEREAASGAAKRKITMEAQKIMGEIMAIANKYTSPLDILRG